MKAKRNTREEEMLVPEDSIADIDSDVEVVEEELDVVDLFHRGMDSLYDEEYDYD